MDRRWPVWAATLFVGCTQAPSFEVRHEPPAKISTDFARLPSILAGIRESADVLLYEGLPSEFWDPQLREEEMSRKDTTRIHGYPFYDERTALRVGDAERFNALLSVRGSYKRYRGLKECGGFNPDYCVVWKTGEVATHALISLECGEIKLFGPQGELYCDLSPEVGQRLEPLLRPYRKNRPADPPLQ